MARTSLASALLVTLTTQWAIVVSSGLLAGIIAGANGAWSCLAGGFAVAAPNSLLAAYLWLKSRQIRVLSAASFLGGELIKLAFTVVAIYLVVRGLAEHLVWLPLVVGIITALKGQWLAVWFTRNV